MLFHLSPLRLLLLIPMGAESGTNICSPLQSISYKFKEKPNLSPEVESGLFYKLVCIRSRGCCKDADSRSPSSSYHPSL